MSGADKNDCAEWCIRPADHDGPCKPPDRIIEEAKARVASWPQWKRDAFKALSSRS